jgi:hypothetical protein
MVEGRVVSPPGVRVRVVLPRALPPAEHTPAHHGGSCVAKCFLDDLVVDIGLAGGKAVHLAEARRREGPLVKPSPPSPSGCSRLWFGPATKPSRDIEMSSVSLAIVPPGHFVIGASTIIVGFSSQRPPSVTRFIVDGRRHGDQVGFGWPRGSGRLARAAGCACYCRGTRLCKSLDRRQRPAPLHCRPREPAPGGVGRSGRTM